MKAFGWLRLAAAVALVLPLVADAAERKPVKTAQECNEELALNRAAIEAAGESAQAFFHRCWWESEPGKPTPLRSARNSWNPGREAKTATPQPKTDSPKPAASLQKALSPKTLAGGETAAPMAAATGATKPTEAKSDDSKPTDSKVSRKKKTSAPAPAKMAVSPPAAPPSAAKVVVTPPATPLSAAKKATKTATKKPPPVRAPLAAAKERTAPTPTRSAAEKAVPARRPPEKPVAVKERVVKSKVVGLPERVHHSRPGQNVRSRSLAEAPQATPRRLSVRRREAPMLAAPRLGPIAPVAPVSLAPTPRTRRALGVCIYAAPDAYGNSACIPVAIP